MATPLLPRWIVLRVSLHTVWYTGEYTIITLLMMGFADHAAYTSFDVVLLTTVQYMALRFVLSIVHKSWSFV